MSDDYITREANGDDFVRRADIVEKFMDRLPSISVGYLCKIADEIPPADVRPVVRGRWEPHPSNPEYDVCSACSTGTRRREYHHQGHVPGVTEFCYWFCPWCGADMREVKNDV